MQSLITTSGYGVTPPSGLTIVAKSLELVTAASSGNFNVSGSLGTLNKTFYVDGTQTIPLEVHFLQGELVTVTPSLGTLVFNYVMGGEPDAYKYAKAAQEYSSLPSIQKWVGSTSGTYQPVSGGFGG
jgi:hypothetical protein